jgi:hypothetical protein
MGMNKVGAEKYYIIISLILGIIVLGLSLFFIFHEYFTDDDISRETCRQSVILRATVPEVNIKGFNVVSFKNQFPLKCKTEVVNIDKDTKDAAQEILDALVSCWYLFGNGDFDVFGSKSGVFGVSSVCVPCARIHFDESVAGKYSGAGKIDLTKALNNKMINGKSYMGYLNNVGKAFPAFNLASAGEFNFDGEEFKVEDDFYGSITMKNMKTGGTEDGGKFGINLARVSLPRYVDARKGDLLIYYGSGVSNYDGGVGRYFPYLFYFQVGQSSPDPFEEIGVQLADGPLWWNINDVCVNWDGIPA